MADQWLRQILDVFRQQGVEPKLLRSKRHHVFELQTKFGLRKMSVSATPSDFRTLRNFRSQLKKLLETGKRN